jgi:hypothetical protein
MHIWSMESVMFLNWTGVIFSNPMVPFGRHALHVAGGYAFRDADFGSMDVGLMSVTSCTGRLQLN